MQKITMDLLDDLEEVLTQLNELDKHASTKHSYLLGTVYGILMSTPRGRKQLEDHVEHLRKKAKQ